MKKFISSKYSIEIGSIEKSSFNKLLTETYVDSKIVIIVDENTHDFCLEYMLTTFDFLKEAEVMLLPVGEENKVMEVCFQVLQALGEYEIGRKDIVINLGGGVVTDMGGFIASIYKRGVDFINIPTTLLGMVDASIGGKNGIDVGPLKNQIGVFAHPVRIFVDPIFLETLPEEDLWNGYAEMLKHALISDKKHWEKLKAIKTFEELSNINLISDSIKIKFDIVEKDPLEKLERKALNLGHTIGHGIEGYLLDKEAIPHGHAVAVGLLAEAHISFKRAWLSEEDFHSIEKTIMEKFTLVFLDHIAQKEVIKLMYNDKKNSNSTINCSLLKGIGTCEVNCAISEEEITESLNYMNTFSINLN